MRDFNWRIWSRVSNGVEISVCVDISNVADTLFYLMLYSGIQVCVG